MKNRRRDRIFPCSPVASIPWRDFVTAAGGRTSPRRRKPPRCARGRRRGGPAKSRGLEFGRAGELRHAPAVGRLCSRGGEPHRRPPRPRSGTAAPRAGWRGRVRRRATWCAPPRRCRGPPCAPRWEPLCLGPMRRRVRALTRLHPPLPIVRTAPLAALRMKSSVRGNRKPACAGDVRTNLGVLTLVLIV